MQLIIDLRNKTVDISGFISVQEELDELKNLLNNYYFSNFFGEPEIPVPEVPPSNGVLF